jgi:hypothetical protein
MSQSLQKSGLSSPARRHLLGLAAAATSSLPLLAIAFPAAAKDHDHDRGDGHPPGVVARDGPQCFLRGTYILTPGGEKPIEELAAGQQVETTNGPLPIKWIGTRTFKRAGKRAGFSSWPTNVVPIRVERLALDDSSPRRALYISPEHSLLIGSALIPVKYLINGKSIAPAAMDGDQVIEYFHIELENHEVIFAEGAPAETLQFNSWCKEFDDLSEYERPYEHERDARLKKPFAPVLGYRGGREELQGLLRLAVSPIVDVRDPIQVAYDRISARAELAYA